MIWRWRACSSASAASSTPQSIEYGSSRRAEKSRAPDFTAFAAFAAFVASAAHLGAVSAERRDSVRNTRTSSRRQVRPSRNLSQNVKLRRVFMATVTVRSAVSLKCSL